GHARLREAALRANHVHDAVLVVAEREQADAEISAVFLELRELSAGLVVDHLQRLGQRWRRVIHGRHGALRAAHLEAARAEPRERLRRRHFVNQVQIDVEHGRAAGFFDHHVFVPDLFEKRLCHAHSAAPVVCSRTCDFSACLSYVPRVTSKRLSAPRYALVLATMTSESAACPCKMAAPPLPCCALRRGSLLPIARTRTLAWPSASMPSVTALMLYSSSSLGACTISSTAVKAACTGPVPTAA